MSRDQNLNRIMNLFRFNVNLSAYVDVGNLVHQSPDYILEKYYHWIGFEPVTDYPHYTPDVCQHFFSQYHKIWGDSSLVRRQLLYLNQTQNLHLLQMVKHFENYIGPISLISSEEKPGLHLLLEQQFIPKVLELNQQNLPAVLRDLRINSLNLS